MLFSKSISGTGLRTILSVPLRQQADEAFDIRLHFAGDAQAEFLSRAALPEFEHGLVPGIRTLLLLAEGVLIDRNMCGLCPSERPAAEILRAYILRARKRILDMFFGEELQGVQKSTIAALCNCLRQIATFFWASRASPQSATSCNVLRQPDSPDRCESAAKTR